MLKTRKKKCAHALSSAFCEGVISTGNDGKKMSVLIEAYLSPITLFPPWFSDRPSVVCPFNLPLSVKVEQTLQEVQISRSRLRFLLLWLEQMAPIVTDSGAAEGAEGGERHPPSLTLANSVLSILKEPLPSDASPSNSGLHDTSPRSRVSLGDTRQPARLMLLASGQSIAHFVIIQCINSCEVLGAVLVLKHDTSSDSFVCT